MSLNKQNRQHTGRLHLHNIMWGKERDTVFGRSLRHINRARCSLSSFQLQLVKQFPGKKCETQIVFCVSFQGLIFASQGRKCESRRSGLRRESLRDKRTIFSAGFYFFIPFENPQLFKSQNQVSFVLQYCRR